MGQRPQLTVNITRAVERRVAGTNSRVVVVDMGAHKEEDMETEADTRAGQEVERMAAAVPDRTSPRIR